MKYLILLEGDAESALISMLINKGQLKISEDEMIDLQPHTKRQLDGYLLTLIRQLNANEKVSILRLGDTQRDVFKIPKDISGKVHGVFKYCTKPEFEMLIIIHENLYTAFQKVKRTVSPKDFVKQRVSFNRKKYNGSKEWICSYFSSVDIPSVLRTYKRLARHAKNEHYLWELVNDDSQQ